MGFFSWACKGCNKDIINIYAIEPGKNQWMNEAVVLKENGSVIIGEYGGYGDIDGMELCDDDYELEMWHKACWKHAGKPDYSGPSSGARYQGHFYPDMGYLDPPPKRS